MGRNNASTAERICPNCGEGNPPAASLQYLFGRRYKRNQCRACAHPLDGTPASGIDRVLGAQNYFAFYFLNAFAWAAIGVVAAASLAIAFDPMPKKVFDWLVGSFALAGMVFGLYRAELTRRRRRILAVRSG